MLTMMLWLWIAAAALVGVVVLVVATGALLTRLVVSVVWPRAQRVARRRLRRTPVVATHARVRAPEAGTLLPRVR